MTYGPTFGHAHIPRDILGRFSRFKRVAPGVYAALRGVCNTKQEFDQLLVQAQGKKLLLESVGEWTGIYCY